MKPCVVSAELKQEHILKQAFKNTEIRLFDIRPFLDKGVFSELVLRKA
jgi:hypothetical protein